MRNQIKFKLSTKISYAFCLILILFYLLIKVIVDFSTLFKKSVVHDIIFILLIILILISFLISIICGINNYIKDKNDDIREKICIIYIALLVALLFSFIVPNKVHSVIEHQKQSKLKNMAIYLLKANIKKNNSIFLYNDLKEINEEIKLFDNNSYMLYRNENELYLCLEYKKTAIYGNIDNLRFSRYRSCEFNPKSFKNEHALKSYLKEYLENKYSIKVTNIEPQLTGVPGIYQGSYISGTEKIESFEIYYEEDKKFNAILQFDNQNIVVTDDYIY